MKLTIEGLLSNDPKARVNAVGGLAQSLSEAVGEDWDDAIVTLVVAAALMTMKYSGETTARGLTDRMAKLVAHAIVVAEHILADELAEERQPH